MPHATRSGDVLGDRYLLGDLLTESGSGRFWRAHDRILERHVAIHVIAADDQRAPSLMEAARRASTVLDRRILRVLDAEVNDDVCYVVNEWAWGSSFDIVVANTTSGRGARPGWWPRWPTRSPRPTPRASRTAGWRRRTCSSTAPAGSG